MLALSLERIRQTPESKLLDVRIFVDTTTNEALDEYDYIRDTYFPEASIFHARPHIYAPSGCWNILNALKSGYESGTEFVFLIEEDVMVFNDYFTWNLEQHGDHFARCGRLRKEHSSAYYTNPGAAFSNAKLKHVVEHINDAYFADRKGYCDRHFGVMDEASDLDDGLIRRVIRQRGESVLYPETPKVAHQGFHYYNRLMQYKITGETIAERIESARALLARVSNLDRYSRDFEPYPLQLQL